MIMQRFVSQLIFLCIWTRPVQKFSCSTNIVEVDRTFLLALFHDQLYETDSSLRSW